MGNAQPVQPGARSASAPGWHSHGAGRGQVMVGRAFVPQRGSGHKDLARAGIFPQSARTAAHQKAAAPHGVQLFDGAGRARRRGEGHGHAHVASVPVHGQVQHFGVQLPDGPQPRWRTSCSSSVRKKVITYSPRFRKKTTPGRGLFCAAASSNRLDNHKGCRVFPARRENGDQGWSATGRAVREAERAHYCRARSPFGVFPCIRIKSEPLPADSCAPSTLQS